jgi:hypothetical protein
MRYEPSNDQLREEFSDLSSESLILEKEVYAHFGLLFMKFGLVEHSMVNVLTFRGVGDALHARKIRSRDDWERTFDLSYENAKAMTFGSMTKRVLEIAEFKDIESHLKETKRLRDYFAHHFMREESRFFSTEDGCWFLLRKIGAVRHAVIEVEELLQPRFASMCSRLKLPSISDEQLSSMRESYLGETREALVSGKAKPGWDSNAL